MNVAILAIAVACVAWKFRQWHDETQERISNLQKRVDAIEFTESRRRQAETMINILKRG